MDQNSNQKDKMKKERRSFLKKSLYSAPILTAMGTLMRPTNAHADLPLPPSLDERTTSNQDQWQGV